MTAYAHLHADTMQTTQEVGFDMVLPSGVKAEVRILQYADGSSDEYSDAMDWTTVTTSGAQQFLFNVDKAAIAAGGPTIMAMRFSPTTGGMGNFNAGSATFIKNWYEYISHWAPETRVTTICDEKDTYRFGFNGQEKDNEVAGLGNHYTATFWEYDSRLGRRWNLDPKPTIGVSDYATFYNNPIRNTDVNGDQPTAFDARDNAMRRLLANGQISRQQYEKFIYDNGVAGAVGGAALLTMFTGGRAYPLLARTAAWLTVPSNQQILVSVGGLTASLLDPNPSSTVDYPGALDDVARGAKLLFRNTKGVDRFVFNTNRLNFFFGRGTGSQSNIDKSLQRAKDFAAIGIEDTKEGFSKLAKYMDKALDAAPTGGKLNGHTGRYEVWKTVDVVEDGTKKRDYTIWNVLC